MLDVQSVPVPRIPILVSQLKKVSDKLEHVLESELKDQLMSLLKLGNEISEVLAVQKVSAQSVDHLLDRAWGSLNTVLKYMERAFVDAEQLPWTEEEQKYWSRVRDLRHTLVGENLDFVRLPYQDQWRESDLRLRRLDDPMREGVTVQEEVDALGLSELTGRVKRLHEAYGEALGINRNSKLEDLLKEWEARLNKFVFGVYYMHGGTGAKDRDLVETLQRAFETAIKPPSRRRRKKADSDDGGGDDQG